MESISRFELSLVSSMSAPPVNRQDEPASVLTVESSSPELDPDELPADMFPLLPPVSLAIELNWMEADEDPADEQGAEVDAALDIVFGTLEGCASHRSASRVKS